MDLLAKLALVATCVVAVYVSVRMLLIWRRARRFPELCIGLNVLSIALGGLVITLLAISLDIGSWMLAGQAFINTPLGLVMAALGLAKALSIALAFFPPAGYARRMERRYARAGEAV